ncbi:hypothetical protein I3900191A7_16290 [Clostridium baratii]|uniref:minor capsid protein n=1 Tax=Clostridium baratii TaxID=1561 RepID=UPI0036F19E00
MASSDYLWLCKRAQDEKIKLSKKQEQQIKDIYKELYIETSKKISKLDPKSLKHRYLEEVKKTYEEAIRKYNSKIKNIIKGNINKSSSIANDVQLNFFEKINEKYSLEMKDTFKKMFGKVPEEAVKEILFGRAYKDRQGLSERIWKDTRAFDKDINYIISKGIADKKSLIDIAKDLEKYVKTSAKRDSDWSSCYPNCRQKVDYNAQRLARTAVNHAFQQAQIRSCKKNPYVEGIQWLTSNSHSRTCDLCKDRDGVIYKVDDVPLDHPNGLCTTIPVIEKSLDAIGQELKDWIDGSNNSTLDNWLNEYGEEFI